MLPTGRALEGALFDTNCPLLPPAPAGRRYEVQRLSDQGRYALKHIPIEAVDPREYGDIVNEIRCERHFKNRNWKRP